MTAMLSPGPATDGNDSSGSGGGDPGSGGEDGGQVVEEAPEPHPGDLVEGNFGGAGVWLPARVQRVNEDGSLALYYEDGDRELYAPLSCVRRRRSLRAPRRQCSC